MKSISLREVMNRPVAAIGIHEAFSAVEEKLRTKKIRHLPVLDEEHRVVGLISQRDLFRIVSPRRTEDGEEVYDPAALDRILLAKVMTHPVVTLRAEDSLAAAVKLMSRDKLGCIPIVDAERRLLGIITKTDILKFLDRAFHPSETRL